jgi:DNA-binding PucR family transcriptional regulator
VLETVGQARDGSEAYRQLAEVYNHLTGLALQGEDVATVTQILAERVGQSVAVLDGSLEPLAVSVPPDVPAPIPAGWPGADQRLVRMRLALGQTRRAVRLPGGGPDLPAVVAGPIIVAGEIVAYVVTFQSPVNAAADFDLLVTEHACTVFAVVMSRERALADVAGQVREDLVEALLAGRIRTAEDRQRWALQLGYKQDRPHRCLVIAVDGLELVTQEPAGAGPSTAALRRAVHRATGQVVSVRAPSAVVAARRDEVVVLAESEGSGPPVLGARSLAEILARDFSSRFAQLTITIGVGGTCSHVDEVLESYEQARRAVRAARRLGRAGQAVAFQDLGLFRLLLQVPNLDELDAFAREVFGDLLDYEARRRAGLLHTLSTYFRHNGSLQRAGEELHVHPNTVSYRLGRVQELSGLMLNRHHDRLLAEVALAIIEGLEPPAASRRLA